MELLKFEPDEDRVEFLVTRMRELIELSGLRDPGLNSKEAEEIRAIRKELDEMGLYVMITYRPNFDLKNPLKSTLTVDIDLFIPKNTTIQ